MSFKSKIRNAVVMLAAGTCAAFFAGTAPAHAQQLQVLGASPPAQDSAPDVITSTRLILHDVTVSGPRLAVAPKSRPVLDYAVKLLREHPATVVNVSGQDNRPAQRRQTQAVAHYLEQRGIPADRVVVKNAALESSAGSGNSANTGVVVLNLFSPSQGV
jgi:outer membrane protein OmpA-like peptidoglycan-associated protein